MKELVIKLPDDVVARLLAASPPLDIDGICASALDEALAGRRAVPKQVKRQAGRPAPPVPKSKRSLYLDEQVWAALENLQRKNHDESLSATTNKTLRSALDLDDK